MRVGGDVGEEARVGEHHQEGFKQVRHKPAARAVEHPSTKRVYLTKLGSRYLNSQS